MGPGPDEVDEIRQQIDDSREHLGEAVGALAYKADVQHRGKEALHDKKEAVMENVEELKGKLPGSGDGEGGIAETIKSKLPSGEDVSDKVDALKSTMPDKAPSSDDVKATAQQAAANAGEHPIAMAAGAAVAGLAAGLALPATDLERHKLAPAAQDARAQAQSAARGAVQQAKAVAKDVVSSAAEAVKQVGQQQGGKLGEAAEKAADKTHDQVNPSS
jgi:hypothetical protein